MVLKQYKIIFLDFDGVVLESADIKNQAFKKMFEALVPEKINEIMEYLEINSGLSRYVKFNYVYSKYLGKKLNESEMKKLGNEFSALCLEGVQKAPFVPGAHEFLEKYSKKTKLFIASGSPNLELKETVTIRGLDKYFNGVFGAPKKKSEVVNEVLAKLKTPKHETVFVGDSMTDYEEAGKAGVPFIGRLSTKTSPFPKGTKIVNDLYGLDDVLSSKTGE
ncbi:HAD-IA family hydrolase [Candidatus Micrarchaeota archaeon]|nr:HAD-IA family hydrolase [Candidatus Micrarchaeota archaeon]MBU1165858.1 HAD-IA family hydrolase [Candidatus Micrarchaeota archaeon]MBU1887020.1 HAD-IA family hydrolase [Candidatus Micrarchaeota archaeon]